MNNRENWWNQIGFFENVIKIDKLYIHIHQEEKEIHKLLKSRVKIRIIV